ncbi:DUF3794 and LysM peptidoglycan-binding domain-containing protein [Desulfovirgula thermocuniculi]|uniref:DUF3794 and LysM peptidoglycan-binding domain-containing protein n=1 Tax=Desulfovirgula thermocuniculi TaxID=348842 RepID=UPI000401EDCA|nr:SPOCS domain-containing protein [Desulfovirgula thermocuniculi]
MAGSAAPATERLRVNQVVNEGTQQVVVRGKVGVPDPKPDVAKIISTDKTASIKKIELVPDKAIVEGVLNLQIVYVAFEPAQSVHHMHQQLPFTAMVELPGVMPGMDATGKVTVEDVSVASGAKDPRQLEVAAVLSVFVKVTEMQEIEVLVECPPGTTCDKETIKVAHVVGSGTKQVIVSEEFTVPAEKPPVEKVLAVDATAEITGKKVLKNKVIVDGVATVQVLYVAAEPDQPVHQFHHSFNFSDFIEVPGADESTDVRVDVQVESAEVEVPDGESVRADLVLKLTAMATRPKRLTVVTKVHDMAAETALLKIDHVVGEGSAQVVLREAFEPPDPKPVAEKIVETTVQQVKVTETNIIDGKVIVRGFLDVSLVYVGKTPDQAVHAVERRLTWRTFVEVPGAKEGMTVDARAVVEFLRADTEGPKIILEAVIKVIVRVVETLQREVVVAAAPGPAVPCPPGETITHVVMPGESFWSIAQKYGANLHDIIKANPGKHPHHLMPGDKILVPCPPAKG